MGTRLAVFDFDGTLFGSPNPPAWRKKDWWGNPISLNPPVVPVKPGDEWWNDHIVEEARGCISDGDTYTVLITGRPKRVHQYRISELVRRKGLKFDEVHLSTNNNFLFKIGIIEKLIRRHGVDVLEMWDDNHELLSKYVEHFKKFEEDGLKVISHFLPPFSLEPSISRSKIPGLGKERVLFSAVFIDSEDTIKEAWNSLVGTKLYPNVISDHITIKFGGVNTSKFEFGKNVNFKIISYAEDDKIQAFGVELQNQETETSYPHITVAAKNGAVNKDAGPLIKLKGKRINGPSLSGILAVSDGNGFFFKKEKIKKTGSVISRMRRLASSMGNKQVSILKWLSSIAKSVGVGQHVYTVGGAVRDYLLEKPIKDVDIVIDSVNSGMDSEEFAKVIMKKIGDGKSKLVTNNYGVAILTITDSFEIDGHDLRGEVIEIANARTESYGESSGKGYKPSDVQKSTIYDDVKRREFTFNTLMWKLDDLEEGPDKAEIIDLTGTGVKDLREGVMRCPSDPDKTLSDDPSRILRAVKFIGRYDFKIPGDVMESIKRNVGKIKNIPHEAVSKILKENILGVKNHDKLIGIMRNLGITPVISEIYNSVKPFKSELDHYIMDDKNRIKMAVDLINDGMFTRLFRFLDSEQLNRFRELSKSMRDEDAGTLMTLLYKPPVNNIEIIEEFNLPESERSIISKVARNVILDNVETAMSGDWKAITEKVKRLMR